MQEKLQRKLGLFPATNIVVANMIGAGIFTTSGLLMAGLNNPLLMLILWLTGGFIAICGALSYGELGVAMPEAGGEYHFLSRLYHPLFGFLSGWVSFIVGFSAPIAASAIGFSEYFSRAFPAFTEMAGIGMVSLATAKKIIAAAVIIIFTLIHASGIKSGSIVQNILTLLKIGLILTLLVAGFVSQNGDLSHITTEEWIFPGLTGWKTIGLSMMWIMFAYSGWNASTYLGSEIRNPSRTLPGSLIAGTVIVILLYLGLNILYIYSIPPQEMKGVISVGGLAMSNLFGESAGKFFSLLIAFALFSSLSAYIIIGPRVYYSMATDGLFFKAISDIHPKFRVPVNSILLQCLLALIMVFSGSFEQILTYMGFSLGIFPILAVVGVFKLRKAGNPAVRMPGFPVVQIIFIVVSCVILILSFLERPVESSIALGTVAAGIPAYLLFKKYSVR